MHKNKAYIKKAKLLCILALLTNVKILHGLYVIHIRKKNHEIKEKAPAELKPKLLKEADQLCSGNCVCENTGS